MKILSSQTIKVRSISQYNALKYQMSTYFSAIKSFFTNSSQNYKFQTFDDFNVKIDINDENCNFSNVFLDKDFVDVESGNISIKPLFTEAEWSQIYKILLNHKRDHKIVTQIFGEVKRRQKALNNYESF